MATIGKLVVDLDARTAKMQAALNRSEGYLRSSAARQKRTLRSLEAGWKRVGRAAGALGALYGTISAGRGMRALLQQADDLQNASRKIGLTTDALQELRFAGEEVGVAANTTDMALQRFTRRLGEAAQGTGELKGILQQYNIAVRDSEGKTREVTDVLGDLANVVSNAESKQEQLRIAFKAFDSEGAALVSVLRRGSEGMEDLTTKAHDLGLVLKQDTVSELAEMNRELEILGSRTDNLFTRILGRGAMAFNDLPIALGLGTPETLGQVDRQIARIADRIAQVKQEIETGDVGWFDQLTGNDDSAEKLKELNAELEKLTKLRSALAREQGAEGSETNPDMLFGGAKFDRILDGIEGRTQSAIDGILRLQGASTAQIEISAIALRVENQLKKENIELDEKQRAELNAALDLLEKKINKQERLAEEQRKAEAAADMWTNTLNQGLADAIFRAESFGDILDALLKRLLNSALFGLNGRGGLLGGITNSIGSALGGLFSFADGGVMTSAGALPLRAYSNGGVASSPQLALYGEGSRPEAYVPLPDGRTIPVTMNGGGQSVNVTQELHFDLIPEPTIQAMIDQAKPAMAQAGAELALKILNRGG